MGIFGLDTINFLSDRIFQVIDKNNDGQVKYKNKFLLFFL